MRKLKILFQIMCTYNIRSYFGHVVNIFDLILNYMQHSKTPSPQAFYMEYFCHKLNLRLAHATLS